MPKKKIIITLHTVLNLNDSSSPGSCPLITAALRALGRGTNKTGPEPSERERQVCTLREAIL